MQSIDALDEFAGGVVIVSHDSRLISRVCDDELRSEVWPCGSCRMAVTTYGGTFGEYRDDMLGSNQGGGKDREHSKPKHNMLTIHNIYISILVT
ncbi:hypothetical protein C2845_PM16G21810 [Panicum miliaceum]|uniref:Uncharacterized protein n=1 Tax=Panicum miliaceum TaxID=4540 RepID=A0A3L6PS06_PANMI|nr:hypothetical protein C2845_PM16G21810 [Panicum miliaceum]